MRSKMASPTATKATFITTAETATTSTTAPSTPSTSSSSSNSNSSFNNVEVAEASPKDVPPPIYPLATATTTSTFPKHGKHTVAQSHSAIAALRSSPYAQQQRDAVIVAGGTGTGSNNVQMELAALRQRGLATLLNKHFTMEIQKLAQEKAAADAALRDLEERKIMASTTSPSTIAITTTGVAATTAFNSNKSSCDVKRNENNEDSNSPLDALYVSVSNWRRECRMKERETLLLYQRYVDKFGSTGVPIQVPAAAGVPQYQHHSHQTPHLHTGSGSKRGNHPTTASSHSMAVAPMEQTLEDHMQQSGLQLPSMEPLGKENSSSRRATKEQELEFRNYYRRLLESKGVDAKARDDFLHPNPVHEQQPYHLHSQSQPALFYADDTGSPLTPDGALQPYPMSLLTLAKGSCGLGSPMIANSNLDNGDDDYDEEDEDYSGEGQDGLGPLFIPHVEDDDSVVSGLTFNSALTREILGDCERTVVTFLKEEKEAIRKMILEEYMDHNTNNTNLNSNHHAQGDAMTTRSVFSSSAVGSASNQATMQAEHMVAQMQAILTKFQEDAATAVGAVVKEARPYDTHNSNEKWMIYYDEYYQREYYHELISNRTQWDPPTVNDEPGGSVCGRVSVSSSSRNTPLLTSQEVMPDLIPTTPQMMMSMDTNTPIKTLSRMELYRRKRRRQRKRRMILLGLVLLIVMVAMMCGTVAYYRQGTMAALWSGVESTFNHWISVARITKQSNPSQSQAAFQMKVEPNRLAELERASVAAALKAQQEAARKAHEQEVAARKVQEQEAARKDEAQQETEKRLAREAVLRKAREDAKMTQELLERLEAERVAREASLDYRVVGRIAMAHFVEDIPLMVKFSSI